MTIAVEQECLERVLQYWRSRGYDVDARLGYTTTNGLTCYAVRSDLVNGLPRNVEAKVPLIDVAVRTRRLAVNGGGTW
jgi:hypothetical protein